MEKLAERKSLIRGTTEEILSRTRELRLTQGNDRYHAVKFNCEHFVTYCLFGTRISTQSDQVHDFFGKTLVYEFIKCNLIYNLVYFIIMLESVQLLLSRVYRWEGLQRFCVWLLPYLEAVAEFSKQHEYLYILIVVVTVLPIVMLFLFMVEIYLE